MKTVAMTRSINYMQQLRRDFLKNLFLAKPDKKYEKSFKAYVTAYKEINDNAYLDLYEAGLNNFDAYLNTLINLSKGINIPEGYVQTSTFWLIDNDEIVGITRVRHKEVGTCGHIGYDISPRFRNKGYGSEILTLALKEAAKLGIKAAIVTCNVDNTASRKIIEKHAGKLLGTIFDEEENENLYKYTISI